MAQKYALVVGCNYANTAYELKGCINDASSMHDMLIRKFGFQKTNVNLLTDDSSSKYKPTAALIKGVLKEVLTTKAKPGDIVFFFFAGHGTIVPANRSVSLKAEQAIVGSDFRFITSVDFRDMLYGCPKGVQFVIMSDSCHSGQLIDKYKEQIGPVPNGPRKVNSINSTRDRVVRMIPFDAILQQLGEDAVPNFNNQSILMPDSVPPHGTQSRTPYGGRSHIVKLPKLPFIRRPLVASQGILMSGCQPNEGSAEQQFDGTWHGVFTLQVQELLTNSSPITYRNLMANARTHVGYFEDNQHPGLYSDDKTAVAYFLM